MSKLNYNTISSGNNPQPELESNYSGVSIKLRVSGAVLVALISSGTSSGISYWLGLKIANTNNQIQKVNIVNRDCAANKSLVNGK